MQEYGYEVSLGIEGATAFAAFSALGSKKSIFYSVLFLVSRLELQAGHPSFFHVLKRDGTHVQLGAKSNVVEKIFV